MKSNYDILGNHIRLIDTRNRESITDRVLEINIDKFFMPSVANVIGTDLSKYKLITKGKFACNPMHVGRDERLPVALYDEEEPAIVSPAYFMFEVVDNSILNEDYLMMWFRRPEFDRICWLHTDGSVRGGITWDDICRLELPIPPIEKQLEIVNSYKAITERIALKKKINDNLVAVGTASIQKNVGRGALINLTEPEMDRLTLPDDFEIQTVSEFCRETKSGSTPSRTNNEYWENGTISWVKSGEVHNNITLQTEEYITPLGLSESSTKLLPKDTVLMAMYGVTAGEVGYLAIEATTNQAICGMICNSKADAAYLYFSLIQSQAAISRLSNGGAQDNLSKNFIDNIKIVVPPSEFIEELNLAAIVEQMTLNTKEIALLEELQATALAQLSSH
ncbi:restriction endonuclease subunit S [[Eubacterium] rectale]|nr:MULTISPECIES: restriction endonuclease subunit S [Bacillota]MBV4149691.1 restriction endonuclease subunit S [Holdemanella biformis]NSE61082.1 restriction endonuclease subunit S [Dorea formicigenerans]NSE87092.1 restriction endonuclease subunit S [Dorea formicigenerans]NSI93201.1 restriction endonuclease subunit S [Agathobacter rectalis]